MRRLAPVAVTAFLFVGFGACDSAEYEQQDTNVYAAAPEEAAKHDEKLDTVEGYKRQLGSTTLASELQLPIPTTTTSTTAPELRPLPTTPPETTTTTLQLAPQESTIHAASASPEQAVDNNAIREHVINKLGDLLLVDFVPALPEVNPRWQAVPTILSANEATVIVSAGDGCATAFSITKNDRGYHSTLPVGALIIEGAYFGKTSDMTPEIIGRQANSGTNDSLFDETLMQVEDYEAATIENGVPFMKEKNANACHWQDEQERNKQPSEPHN